MPLSYHWNPGSLQIVSSNSVHLLPADDIRYPWALLALSQSEKAVLAVLNGEVPVFVDLGAQWTASVLPESADPTEEDAWQFIDMFDDSIAALAFACEYLLVSPDAQRVRVTNEQGVSIFDLARNFELATS